MTTGLTLEFNITFTCQTKPLFTKYITEDKSYPLYESSLLYRRQNVDKIV